MGPSGSGRLLLVLKDIIVLMDTMLPRHCLNPEFLNFRCKRYSDDVYIIYKRNGKCRQDAPLSNRS